ncbi:MAG: IPT/TIG domain-containing protein [Gammaproteobacteria bacterium]
MRGIATLLTCVLILLYVGNVWAEVQYLYDEATRLVQVVDATGDAAHYQYDAAGNIVAIHRHAASDLAITEFMPESGPVGTTVTIYGVGFSPTPANNRVLFNGC